MIDEGIRVMWHTQAAARIVDDQALIVLTRRSEVLVLNPSGTWLWNLLGEAYSVRDMAMQLATCFCLAEAQALADVGAFVASLLAVEAVVVV